MPAARATDLNLRRHADGQIHHGVILAGKSIERWTSHLELEHVSHQSRLDGLSRIRSACFQKAQKLHDRLISERNRLKILIVYDTTTVNRNTEKVAKAISEVLKEKGLDNDCLYVKDVDPATAKNYDCVLAGSPTQAFRATEPMTHFLDGLAKSQFSGKAAAAFDTQLQSRFSGNAAEGIEKKLQKLGFKIIMQPLVIYVEGKMPEMNLKQGELEKAKKYAEDLAKALKS